MEKGNISSLYSLDFIREIKQIIAQARQKAYTAILSGESIPGVRFRYDFDTESYLKRHMWD